MLQARLFHYGISLFILFLQLCLAGEVRGEGRSIEYKIKASLVFKFLSYISWPQETLDRFQNLRICLVGSDLYGNALQSREGEVVQGKAVSVIVSGGWSPALADDCHAVIFTDRNAEALKVPLQLLASKAVLTIAETDSFLEDGGIIKLLLVNDRVGFEINLAQAKLGRLEPSSKLLRLAQRVIS